MGKRRGASRFWEDFSKGWSVGDAIGKRWEEGRLKNDLREADSAAGPTSTETASGEDALTAATSARDQALSEATTDDERRAIESAYGQTIKSLESSRGEAAGVVHSIGVGDTFRQQAAPFSPNDSADAKIAAREGVYRRHGKDEEADRLQDRLLNRKATNLQIGEAQDKADTRKKLKEVDSAMGEWAKTQQVPKDDNGRPVMSDDFMVNMGKQRTFELANRGLFQDAMGNAQEALQYATRKIQAESVERQAAVRDAVAAAGMGDFGKAMEVYNRFVPDGSKATGVAKNKDGTFTVQRVSSVDGSALPSGSFKSLDQFVSSLNSLADSNALTSYIDRTFKHDIESRRLGIDGARVGIAQKESDRAGEKWGIEKPEVQARAGDASKQREARQGLMDAIEKGDTKEIEKARAKAVAAGVKFDKPNNEFSAVTDSMGKNVTRTNKDTGQIDIIDPKTSKVTTIPAPGTKPAGPSSQEDAHAQAKAAVAAGASKASVNARLKQLGFKELP